MVLLQLLEATTGMGYCRICCQPTPSCLCSGAHQSVPTETCSQVMARIPGQGVVASIGCPTTPEAATTEVQEPGVTSPPPGLTPLDFTNWSLPLPEAPLTGGLPVPLGGPPGIGRQTAGPQAPTPPMQVPSAPQGMLPIHQQRPRQPAAPYQQAVQQMSQPAAPYQQAVQQMSQPAAPYQQAVQQPSQPATPYQQAVQPPRRPAGRGGVAQLPSSSTAPAASQPAQERGWQPTRGHGLRGRSVSRPGMDGGLPLMSPQLPPQEPLCLSQATVQGPGILTQLCWLPSTAAVGGRRTWSMYSRSTTGITFRLLSCSLSGCWSGNSSLTALWQRKPKH